MGDMVGKGSGRRFEWRGRIGREVRKEREERDGRRRDGRMEREEEKELELEG